MDIKLFLEYLPWLREPRYLSVMLGLNENYTAWIEKRTTPIPRNSSLDLKNAPTSIQRLFEDHDLRFIHMLHITFWKEPRQLEQGWGFADMTDVNFIVTPSGRIEAYYVQPIHAIPESFGCVDVLAKDLESFLEALFYAQFNQSHFLRGSPTDSALQMEKTVLVAKHCALLAGGYEYYDFWSSLLGIDLNSAPRDNNVVDLRR